ncbi:MAG: sigma-54-dependent Fis family transcriptional regulator [Blastocatellia bacterium]|nr:sigma-54-dependent Fis family transcriptional regulator [Blastocatellia bacterium]
MSARLLIAEDNADMREFLQELLEDAGFETLLACDGREALAFIERAGQMIDLVITDVRMPAVKGDELLAIMGARRPETPVIVITAFGSVEQAVEMVKKGAFQYLTKPFASKELLGLVEEALQMSAPHREHARLRRESPATPAQIIGASQPMRQLFEIISIAARNTSTVLIAGESGTGKELVGRAIHEMSERKGAFVPLSCAAIPAELIEAELFGHTGGAFTGAKQARSGLFEAANGGTIFLDEIGELSLAMQPKLLRALQDGAVRRVGENHERTIDVRVIAATNRDLEQEVRAGRFREDLYWRLNVILITVPPLRDRAFDIPLLVEHFTAKASQSADKPVPKVSADALALLTAYPWPGNVRELENAIERAIAFAQGATVTPEDLPKRVSANGAVSAIIARSTEQNYSLRDLEREYIFEMLRRTGGNKKRTAEILGLDRKTLYRKLEEYRTDGYWPEL